MNQHLETSAVHHLPKTIVLVGLMGAGKSCIGRRLATRLDVEFIDADAEIEKAAGLTIAEIFEKYGEAYFRDGERRVMARLLQAKPCVLAAGGGAFMDDETRHLIKQQATSLWLRAELETLVARTKGRGHRPLLNNGDPRETLQNLMTTRYPIYSEADVAIDTGIDNPNVTAARALDALEKHMGTTLATVP